MIQEPLQVIHSGPLPPLFFTFPSKQTDPTVSASQGSAFAQPIPLKNASPPTPGESLSDGWVLLACWAKKEVKAGFSIPERVWGGQTQKVLQELSEI